MILSTGHYHTVPKLSARLPIFYSTHRHRGIFPALYTMQDRVNTLIDLLHVDIAVKHSLRSRYPKFQRSNTALELVGHSITALKMQSVIMSMCIRLRTKPCDDNVIICRIGLCAPVWGKLGQAEVSDPVSIHVGTPLERWRIFVIRM